MKTLPIVIAAALAVALSACGDGEPREKPGAAAETAPANPCADHVGKPLAEVLGEDESGGAAVDCDPQSDREGFVSMFNGCYDADLKPVEGVEVVMWLADGGTYYGRTDDNLVFVDSELSLSEAGDAVDC